MGPLTKVKQVAALGSDRIVGAVLRSFANMMLLKWGLSYALHVGWSQRGLCYQTLQVVVSCLGLS